jgi:hypothetical protein
MTGGSDIETGIKRQRIAPWLVLGTVAAIDRASTLLFLVALD